MYTVPALQTGLEIRRIESMLRDAHQSLVRAGTLSDRTPTVDQRTCDVLIAAIQDGLDDLARAQARPDRDHFRGRLRELARFSHELDSLERLLSSGQQETSCSAS
jgi:hypothetical protein